MAIREDTESWPAIRAAEIWPAWITLFHRGMVPLRGYGQDSDADGSGDFCVPLVDRGRNLVSNSTHILVPAFR